MKLIAFLLLFNSLLVGLFASDLINEEINLFENYKVFNFTVGDVNRNINEVIEKHSIINVKIHRNNNLELQDIKTYINGDKVENSEIFTINDIKNDDNFVYYQYVLKDDFDKVFSLKIKVNTFQIKEKWQMTGIIVLNIPEQIEKFKVYNYTVYDDINYAIVEENSIINIQNFENGFLIEGLRELMNEEEIDNSEYISFLGFRREEINPRADDLGYNVYYQFFIKNVTDENLLPQIKFSSFDDDKNEKIKEVVKLRLKNESFEHYKIYNYTISDDVTNVFIESNSIANIKIYSDYKTEKNNRILINQEEIENSEYITILSINKEGYCRPFYSCNGFVVYQMVIKDITDNENLLPQLQFGAIDKNGDKEEKEVVIFKLKEGELPYENYKKIRLYY